MERKFKKPKKTGKRIFIGIIPPSEIQSQARDIQRSLKKFSYKLNFVNLEQIHLTLKFLGDNVSPDTIDLIYDTLQKYTDNIPPFYLNTSSIKFGFARQKKASVVYLKIEQNENLSDLVTLIQKITKNLRLNDISNKKERVEFTSHITIARVRKDISNSQIKQIRQTLSDFPFQSQKFMVEKIDIIESKLTKKGPIYSIYYRLPFTINQ